jgi:hypothetical protein
MARDKHIMSLLKRWIRPVAKRKYSEYAPGVQLNDVFLEG